MIAINLAGSRAISSKSFYRKSVGRTLFFPYHEKNDRAFYYAWDFLCVSAAMWKKLDISVLTFRRQSFGELIMLLFMSEINCIFWQNIINRLTRYWSISFSEWSFWWSTWFPWCWWLWFMCWWVLRMLLLNWWYFTGDSCFIVSFFLHLFFSQHRCLNWLDLL